MYTQFFRLAQTPFSIAPDPRYVYMSERHREALAHLLYGINGGGGFVLLTGEIGAGKTTICRCFLEQVPANCRVAYIFNPKLTVPDLLRTICDEFRIALPREAAGSSVKDYVDALNQFLLASYAKQQNNVLIIDEAQNLSADVLEQLRLLTNLETSERKLLQIILIGQPELRTMLAHPELEQLAQRVIARYHLEALSVVETAGYIAHRLAIAGLKTAPPFRPRLMKTIHQLTGGIPRRINLLCDRALLGAYAESRHEVDRRTLQRAAREVFTGRPATSAAGASGQHLGPAIALAVGLLAAVSGGHAWWLQHRAASHVPAAAAAVPRPTPISVAKPSTPAAPIQQAITPVAASVPSTAVAEASASAMTPATLPDDGYALHRALAQLWNVSLGAGEPCEQARQHDLLCYASNAGFNELRQLDRPALLSMHDDAGNKFFGLLLGLNNTEARLRIGEALHTLSAVALARQFDGEFVTFWHAPQNYRGHIEPGDRGPDVDWLAAQLAKLNGEALPPANQPFDGKLERQVRDFQFAQGLKVDGLVGPRTMMLLNRAAGIDEPRLANGLRASNRGAS